MNQLDRTTSSCLETIDESCVRLRLALHERPEAVWTEFRKLESACRALTEISPKPDDTSAEAAAIAKHVETLRVQLAKHGLIDSGEFAAFREGVSAIQLCVDRLRRALRQRNPSRNDSVKLWVFYCSNNFDPSSLTQSATAGSADTINAIGLPCSGKVDVPYLIKALETGADGVAIVACPRKECRHFEGSMRAHKRAEAVESLLAEIGLGCGHMTVIECTKDDAGHVQSEIKQFVERVRYLPRSCAADASTHQQEHVAA